MKYVYDILRVTRCSKQPINTTEFNDTNDTNDEDDKRMIDLPLRQVDMGFISVRSKR